MLSKILVTTLTFGLAALTACAGGSGKMKMSHTLKGGGTAGTTGIENKDVSDLVVGKACIPLKEMVDLLAKDDNGAKTFTVYIQTRSISEPQYTNDIIETFNLLVTPVPALIEYSSGADLANSQLLGPYLSVVGNSSCDQVSFARPGGKPGDVDTFTAQKSAQATRATAATTAAAAAVTPAPRTTVPNRTVPQQQQPQQPPAQTAKRVPDPLILSNDKGETREYKFDKSGNLIVDVTYPIAGAQVKACNGNQPSSLTVRTRYVMNLSGKDGGLKLWTSWAKLLVASVKDSGALKASVANVPDDTSKVSSRDPKKNTTAPDTTANPRTGIPVSTGDLTRIQQQIQAKQFGTIKCN